MIEGAVLLDYNVQYCTTALTLTNINLSYCYTMVKAVAITAEIDKNYQILWYSVSYTHLTLPTIYSV